MVNRVGMSVNVIAQKKANTAPDDIAYHLEDEEGRLLESLVFSKDNGMKKGDEHEITFTLIQDEGMNLQFATPPDAAMWVNRGTANHIPSCPMAQPAKNNAVFHATASNASVLVATNKNPQKCFYRFSLNFVDAGSKDPSYLYRYDPIADNRNGGSGGYQAWALFSGVGAAVAIAYFAYLAFYR